MIGPEGIGRAVRRIVACVAFCAVLVAAAFPVGAAEAGKLVASTEPGWPQWRGPRRDGVSDETGLLQAWPAGGPKLIWKLDGIGRGYSCPIVSRGTLYITGDVGKELRIFAISPAGKVTWQTTNGRSWAKPFPGSRAVCCYRDGRVYNMNAHGTVVCLDARTGRKVWGVDILRRFGAKNVTWGTTECVLVDGPGLIVTPAGARGLMAALDRKTGKTLWKTRPLPDEQIGYGSPILMTRGSKRLLVTTGSRHTFAVDAEAGKLLWTFRHTIPEQMVTTIPVLWSDSVFITNSSRYDYHFYRLRMNDDNTKAEKVWTAKLSNAHGSVICVAGRLCGASDRKPAGCLRLDPHTGKPLGAPGPEVGDGAVIFADGRVYCLACSGTMLLLKPSDKGFETTGRFDLVKLKKGRQDAWAHPVICDGRLYLRYHDTLYCYDISAK